MRRSRSIFVRDPSSPAAWKARGRSLVSAYVAVTIGAAVTLFLMSGVGTYMIVGGTWAIYTAAFVWRMRWIRRHLHPPGHCARCGYSLTGNVSGVCPECGTPAA